MNEFHRRLPSKNILCPTLVVAAMAAGLAACQSGADRQEEKGPYGGTESPSTLVLPTITSLVEATASPIPEKTDRPAKLGEKVADFSLLDVNGNLVKLSDFSGRPVVIFCCYPVSLRIEETLAQLSEYHKKGLEVLFIVYSGENPGRRLEDFNFTDIVTTQSDSGANFFDYFSRPYGNPSIYAIDGNRILVDQRDGLDDFIRMDLLYEKLLRGEPVVEPQIPVDPALMGFPTSLEAKRADTFSSFLPPNNLQVTADDRNFLNQNGQDLNYLLDETNIENTIELVLEKTRERGKRLAQIYCRGGDQPDTYRAMVYNGTFTINKFEMYKHAGLLVDLDWAAVAADLKPDCPIRDFPTQN